MAGEQGGNVRTFVAIELDPVIREALAALQGRLKRAPLARLGRWVAPGGIHLTIKFLGDVPAGRLPEVQAAIERGAREVPPFALTVAGLGCFPNCAGPRVIWTGVREPTGALARLQRAVERELAAVGFPPEGRRFSPHLTLARIRNEAPRRERAELGAWIEQQPNEELGSLRVDQVALMRSILRPDGAVYSRLGIAALQHVEV